jgi:hypothetical protein
MPLSHCGCFRPHQPLTPALVLQKPMPESETISNETKLQTALLGGQRTMYDTSDAFGKVSAVVGSTTRLQGDPGVFFLFASLVKESQAFRAAFDAT